MYIVSIMGHEFLMIACTPVAQRPPLQTFQSRGSGSLSSKSLPFSPYEIIIFQFLPRDAMLKRGPSCRTVSVRQSVYPSVTFMYCIKTAEDIVKLLFLPDSTIT